MKIKNFQKKMKIKNFLSIFQNFLKKYTFSDFFFCKIYVNFQFIWKCFFWNFLNIFNLMIIYYFLKFFNFFEVLDFVWNCENFKKTYKISEKIKISDKLKIFIQIGNFQKNSKISEKFKIFIEIENFQKSCIFYKKWYFLLKIRKFGEKSKMFDQM